MTRQVSPAASALGVTAIRNAGGAVLPENSGHGSIHCPAVEGAVAGRPALGPVSDGQQRAAAARAALLFQAGSSRLGAGRSLSGPFVEIEDAVVRLIQHVDAGFFYGVQDGRAACMFQNHPSNSTAARRTPPPNISMAIIAQNQRRINPRICVCGKLWGRNFPLRRRGTGERPPGSAAPQSPRGIR